MNTTQPTPAAPAWPAAFLADLKDCDDVSAHTEGPYIDLSKAEARRFALRCVRDRKIPNWGISKGNRRTLWLFAAVNGSTFGTGRVAW